MPVGSQAGSGFHHVLTCSSCSLDKSEVQTRRRALGGLVTQHTCTSFTEIGASTSERAKGPTTLRDNTLNQIKRAGQWDTTGTLSTFGKREALRKGAKPGHYRDTQILISSFFEEIVSEGYRCMP